MPILGCQKFLYETLHSQLYAFMRKDNHISSVSNAIRYFRHLKGITNDHQGFHDLNMLVWRVVMELLEEGVLKTIPLG
jgi:hypothetical protein